MSETTTRLTTPACPYPGLRPFTSNEADRFFGRGQQVEEMLAKLEERRFMAVVGVSGCGKSSLVRAGLIPAIEQGFLSSDAEHWRIARMRPGGAPYGRLGEALLQPRALGPERGNDPRSGALLEAILRRGSLGLARAVVESGLPTSTNLLLLVDQFEELFRFRNESAGTRGTNDADAFVRLLLDSARPPRPGAGADTDGQVYVVLTMRSDFLGDCALFTGLPEAVNDSQFLTPRLTRAQYREAIEEPARLYGGTLDPALVSRLLNDMRADPDQLPVLQHALMRMWTRAAVRPGWDRRLTLADYQAPEIGGLKAALSNHCDQVLASLNPPQKQIAEVLFRALSERSDSSRDTRRPTALGRIGDLAGVGMEAVAPVVEVFRHPDRSFLTPPPPEELGPETVLDISHESLISHWQTLDGWVRAEAGSADHYQRLEAASRRWKEGKGALWIDPDLEYALRWREGTRPSPAWAARYGGDFGVAMAFLDAGCEQRERQRKEREAGRKKALRRARSTALIAFLGLVVVGWGWIERQRALEIEQRLNRDLLNNAVTHSALLSRGEQYIAAKRILSDIQALDPEIPESRRLARKLLIGQTEILGGLPERIYEGAGSPLSQVVISPEGRWVAAGGERGTLVLFDAESGELVHRLTGHDPREQIRDIVVHPAGHWLASSGNDHRIILWTLPSEDQAPQILRQWQALDAVMSLAVSPDGQLLASGGDDQVVRLWDPDTGEPVDFLEGHTGRISEVTGLAFSPDGKRLASASCDGTARIWDVALSSEVAVLDGHGKTAVKSVAFSADSDYLATGADDNRVILWEIKDREPIGVFSGHQNTVYGLAFAERTDDLNAAPLLIAGGFDRTLRVWDVETAVTLRVLQGHTAAVNGIAVRDTKLYSASSDGTIRRWDLSLPHQRLLDVIREPASVAVSPDGHLLVVGFVDGGLCVFTLADLSPTSCVDSAHAEDVQRLAFSQDGALLASAGFDTIARTWRVLPHGVLEPLQTLTGHTDAVHAVAFSPDGYTLATAGYDGLVGLFDTRSGKGRFIESTQGQVLSVAFDPTGRLVYAGDRDDGRIRVWDVATSPPVLRRDLAASEDFLMWAEPDADGRQIAAVGRDYVVSVLDARDGAVLHTLVGNENAVFKARFLPGGDLLATAAADATVRLWDLSTESELFVLRLPANQGQPIPLWDFDFRCTPTGCWVAVPLTRGKVALYNFGKPVGPQ